MKHPLRHWLEYAGLSAAAWVVARLDYKTLLPLATLLGSIVYQFDKRGRRLAPANIEAAFPGKFTAREKSRIARASYATFARTMLGLFWAPNLNWDFVRENVVFEGWEHDTCRKDPAKPAIYCCMHFSNFELLSLVSVWSITNGPVIAQRFKNPLLGPVFDRLRASTGNHVIPQERAMVKMLKHLRSGGKFGMLIDLNLDPREGSVPIMAFGGLVTSVTQAHVAIAQRTGAAIVPVECRPLPGGRYRIIHHRPIECPADADPASLAQQCWNTLEPGIHTHPECWLWAYKHWRFRPLESTARYPWYSNPHPGFEAMAAPLLVANPQAAA